MSKEIQCCVVADYVPIENLSSHPDNEELRTITRDRLDDLKLSIIEKGFYEPILVWTKNDWVLAGNHRLKAAKELIAEGYHFHGSEDAKHNQLPVVYEDCTEDRAKAILFETNKQYASWIDDRLEAALREAEEAGTNLKQYGYSDEELDELLKTAAKDAEEDLSDPDTTEPSAKSTEIKEDEYAHLVLLKPIHEQLTSVLGEIAQKLNPHWQEGDALNEPTQVLCQAVRESGLLEELE